MSVLQVQIYIPTSINFPISDSSIMSTVCSLFFLLICLSSCMHVYCEAHYIGRRSGHSKGSLSTVERSSLGIDSSTKGSVLVKKADFAAGDQLKGSNHEKGGANSSAKIKGMLGYAGSENILESPNSSAQMGLRKDKATCLNKESTRSRELSAKETIQYNNSNTGSNKNVEDYEGGQVGLSDYEQPHPTPPVHNRNRT